MDAEAPADELLLQRFVQHADRQALDDLLRRHVDLAYRVAKRILGTGDEAEDAVQSAFIQVIVKADQYRPTASVKSWVLAIVANAALKQIRGSARRRKHELMSTEMSGAKPGADSDDMHADIREAVQQLPNHERLPVCLRFMDGLSFTEIAAILGTAEGTVRSQVHRGLEHLRERLKGYGRPVGASLLLAVLVGTSAEGAPPSLVAAVSGLAHSGSLTLATATGATAITKFALVAAGALVIGVGAIAMQLQSKPAIAPATVLQAQLIVAPNGDDANPGTLEQPLATIQHAVDLARAGDTIAVRSGTYHEQVVMRHSGSEGKPIVLRNYPGEYPILTSDLEKAPFCRIELCPDEGDIGWITIQGMEILEGFDGIKLYGGHDVNIVDNRLLRTRNTGIIGTGCRVTIDRNRIEGSGGGAIMTSGTSITITNNLIRSNSGGIQLVGDPYQAEVHPGVEYSGARQWVIANNTIVENDRFGVLVWQPGAEDSLIADNIFYRNAIGVFDPADTYKTVYFYTSGKGHLLRNNLLYSDSPGAAIGPDGAGDSYLESGSIIADPMFVDPQSGNFHLSSASPAIDAGRPEPYTARDFDNGRRPQGLAGDLGAFEFGASPAR